MSVRTEYDQKLVELKHELIRMASLVEEVLAGAMRALVARDLEAAQRIIDSDDEIDDLQMDIEDRALRSSLRSSRSPRTCARYSPRSR